LDRAVQVDFLDASGWILSSERLVFDQNQLSWNISALPQGLYFVKLTGAQKGLIPDNALELRYESLTCNKSVPFIRNS
jgi:hypothetical protein